MNIDLTNLLQKTKQEFDDTIQEALKGDIYAILKTGVFATIIPGGIPIVAGVALNAIGKDLLNSNLKQVKRINNAAQDLYNDINKKIIDDDIIDYLFIGLNIEEKTLIVFINREYELYVPEKYNNFTVNKVLVDVTPELIADRVNKLFDGKIN